MTPAVIRRAILTPKEQGRPLRDISRALKVSRHTVRQVPRDTHGPEAPRACGRDRSILVG